MSKEIINVQMDKEYYEKVTSGGSEGGSVEDRMLFFDASKLREMTHYWQITMTISGGTSFVPLLVEYIQYDAYKIASLPLGKSYIGDESLKFIGINNRIEFVGSIILGSGGPETPPEVEGSLTLYEYLELLVELHDFPFNDDINLLKGAEVSAEVVKQWIEE